MKDINKSQYYDQLVYFVSNFDILNIFPDAKIVTFANLEKYADIYELLPHTMDFVFLLTESEKNKGHWTLLMRNDDKFEYFDSYGNSPKEILKFTPAFMNKYLGNDWDMDLGKMIKSIKGKGNFKYNTFAFQNIKNTDIATCGRWCVYRVYQFLVNSRDKADFEKHVKEQKKVSGLTMDETICILVSI